VTALDELAAAIRPYRLPPELERFWQQVDAARLGTEFFPELIAPSLALAVHRENLAAFPHCGPAVLLPVAYESQVFLSVDLETGEVWRWAFDEDEYQLVYPTVGALVEAAAAGESGPGDVLRRIGREVDAWPAAWLAASGVDLRDREPRGATHAIASLVGTAPATVPGPVRITGTIVRLAGVGFDYYAVVDDGSGTLEVHCPAGSPWLPVHGRRFELEVTLVGGAATATAVRPLD
jgi:hypothetical protein